MEKKGHCKHGEFSLLEGCAQCVSERRQAGIRPEQDELEDGLNSEGLTLAPSIVKVRYYSETTGELSAREYTYYSESPLKVGDIVTVPVRDTTAKAKVSAVDVPETEIAAFKDKVKTIPMFEPESPHLNQPDTDIPTAVINIAPDTDSVVIALYQESQNLLKYAQDRVITHNADLTSATEDLTLISKLKKAIEDKRKEYVNPIRAELDKINAAFKNFTAPLEQADGITRGKIMFYRKEVERRRAAVEEIERQKTELAKREAELNNGEITVDLTPIAKPMAAPEVVRTDAGNTSMVKVRKWEVEDISKVPAEYLQVDSVAIGKLVRAGIRTISGIKIWEEETIRVSTR